MGKNGKANEWTEMGAKSTYTGGRPATFKYTTLFLFANSLIVTFSLSA